MGEHHLLLVSTQTSGAEASHGELSAFRTRDTWQDSDDQASSKQGWSSMEEHWARKNNAERGEIKFPWTPSMGYHDIIVSVYYSVIGCNATRNK